MSDFSAFFRPESRLGEYLDREDDYLDREDERRARAAMADDEWLNRPIPTEAELTAREAEYFEPPEDRYYPSASPGTTNMSIRPTARPGTPSQTSLKLFKEGSRVIYPSINQIPGTVRHVGSNGVTVKWDDGELTVAWPENL